MHEVCFTAFYSLKSQIMKKNFYLKHDAPSFTNQKLALLLQEEGARGYGIYWYLLEVLRVQSDLSLPESMLGTLARQISTHKSVVVRVVNNYNLFSHEDGRFYSAGLYKRMEKFLLSRDENPQQNPQFSGDNMLIYSVAPAYNAGTAEERKEENNNNCNYRRDFPSEKTDRNGTVNRAAPVMPVGAWEALVDEMQTYQEWMDMIGMHSGLGKLFLKHQDRVVALFKNHIRLYDKGGGLLYLSHVRQYFANFLADGSTTCKKVKATLLSEIDRENGNTAGDDYCHETLIGGQRTYLGRPIPADAPPRPDAYAVWDDQTARWTR